ncbi:DUF6291 domain-containing protein [Slackia sp.]|uniref:DUF6291 domain-containing protein n=1 Tax=Slackia sp. TaxID=2049041 RepID=UPI003A976405
MAESFTWFAKFGDVFELLEEEDGVKLAYAIAEYGMFGREPDSLPFHLSLAFTAMREDIDHSKMKRAAGSKGGRPRKQPEKPDNKPCLKPVSKPDEKLVLTQNNTEQNNTEQNNPEQNIKKGGASRFSPPSENEVRKYCEEHGYGIDPAAFVSFYTSNGWMIGRSKMKDWKAAVRTWVQRNRGNETKEAENEAGEAFSQWQQ